MTADAKRGGSREEDRGVFRKKAFLAGAMTAVAVDGCGGDYASFLDGVRFAETAISVGFDASTVRLDLGNVAEQASRRKEKE